MTDASLWNPGSDILSVNANTTLITQLFTATEAQTVFNITAFQYAPATGSLLVFRNGQLIKLGIVETNSTTFTVAYTDLNAGDEILAMGFVGITATTIDVNAPFSHAVDYFPHSVGSKLQLEVNIADSPFNAVFGGDIFTALQDAVDMPGVSRVIVPNMLFNLSGTIVISRPNVEIVGRGAGMIGNSNDTYITCTAGVTLDSMIYVTPGLIGFSIQDIHLDANGKAKTTLHRDVVSGNSSHFTLMRNITVQGYTEVGITLGDKQLVTLNSGQLTLCVLDNITWQGGTAGAIGLTLNAQNCEFIDGRSFNMIPSAGKEHSYHIYGRAGGIRIKEICSTRSTTYAIRILSSQVVVDMWRAEDQFLITGDPVGIEGPCSFRNILHRSSATIFSDITIDWSMTGSLQISNADLRGSVAINSTNAKRLNLDIKFLQKGDGAGYLIFGPQNNFGQIFDADTGQLDVQGTAPYVRCNTQDGIPVIGMDSTGFTIGSSRMTWGVAIPTTGSWHRGDIIWNVLVVPGGKVGFVCTTTGTPGSWKAFGVVDA